MKILIVGAGMYVTGRNNSGTGTILSSIAQYSKSSIVDEVVIVARNHENASVIQTETDRINNTIDSNLKTRFEPISVANDLRSDKMDVTNRFDAAIISVPDHLHFEYF